jgi:hypothetical protein
MVRRRKKALVAAAIVGTLLLAGTILPALQPGSEAWSGRRTLDVNVHVTQADGARPIAGAQINVYDHPLNPQEGQLPKLDSRALELRSYATDADGVCRFEHEFRFAGSRVGKLAGEQITTPDAWIKVSAAGRQSAFVPLASRSGGVRRIGDESPIVVHVALKPGVD